MTPFFRLNKWQWICNVPGIVKLMSFSHNSSLFIFFSTVLHIKVFHVSRTPPYGQWPIDTHKNIILSGGSSQIDGLEAGDFTFEDSNLIRWMSVVKNVWRRHFPTWSGGNLQRWFGLPPRHQFDYFHHCTVLRDMVMVQKKKLFCLWEKVGRLFRLAYHFLSIKNFTGNFFSNSSSKGVFGGPPASPLKGSAKHSRRWSKGGYQFVTCFNKQ